MEAEEYNKIKSYCKKKLLVSLHGRHLEDVTQYVAMQVWLKPKGNWAWFFSDYCRLNGLSIDRSKRGARTLENATLVGEDNYKIENNVRDTEAKGDFLGEMDGFISKLALRKEIHKWVMKIQEKRLSQHLHKKVK